MKNVDVLFPGWIKAPNGAANFVNGLNDNKKEFEKYGVNLSVYTLDDIDGEVRIFSDRCQVKKRSVKFDWLQKLSKVSFIITYLLIERTILRHAKRIVEFYHSQGGEADCYHFQDLFTCYYFILQNKNNSRPIYLTLHGNGELWSMLEGYYPLFRSSLFAAFKRKIEKTLFNRVDLFNFVADAPRHNFCKLYPLATFEKTSFVYNGIPDITLTKREKDSEQNIIRMVCVGTINNRKNQIGIIQALSFLSEEEQKLFSLTFVGDGPCLEIVRTLAAKIKSEVVFVGSTDKVNDYLLKADVFILFSKDEGLPISILEAMRCRLPIISTNIAGIPEMIETGESGYLMDVDIECLKNLFQKMLCEKPNLIEMGEYSRKIYENKFSQKSMIESYSRLWNHLCD